MTKQIYLKSGIGLCLLGSEGQNHVRAAFKRWVVLMNAGSSSDGVVVGRSILFILTSHLVWAVRDAFYDQKNVLLLIFCFQ